MPVKELGTHLQFASWRVPQFPRAIEYPLEVMEEIRAFACDELLQLSHGGDEVGGVLFGTRREDLVRILTWRPMACEHLEGEGLRLSYNDRMNLAVQLEVARQNPDLKDLRPVGWFVSHLSGEVALSASDLETYYGFFPEAWQVALVIRPQGSGRAQAGFFVRETDGKLQSEKTYHCFELERIQPAKPGEPSPAAAAVTPEDFPPIARVSSTEQPVGTASATAEPTAVRVTKLDEPAPASIPQMEPESPALPPESTTPAPPSFVQWASQIQWPPLPPASSTPLRSPLSPPSPTAASPAPLRPPMAPPAPVLPTPNFQLDEATPARERWLWAIPIVLALGIAAFLLYQRQTASPPSFGLRAWNEGQSMQLAWNAGSKVIRDSYRGELEINDGSKDSHISLTTDQLHAGKLTYFPQSGDVAFAMTVYTTTGDSMRDSTRVIAPAFNSALSQAPPPISSSTPVPPVVADTANAPNTPSPATATSSASTTSPTASAPPAVASTPAPTNPDDVTLQQQVQELKTELGKERAHADELQNLVRILENRLGIESTPDRSAKHP